MGAVGGGVLAHQIGTPGGSAAIRGLRDLSVLTALVVVLIVIPSTWLIAHQAATQGALGLVVALAAAAGGLRWRRADLREIFEAFREGGNWIRGARGEALVAQELARLGDGFLVFHDFHPVASGGARVRWNVDHIVVGPSGVFVLDAKNPRKTRIRSASHDKFSQQNVDQVQRNALDLKEELVSWSAKALTDLFVVPVVVYVNDGASLETLNEGAVRTLPLRLLTKEIATHTEAAIDVDRLARVARVLFERLPLDVQMAYSSEVDAFRDAVKRLRAVERAARPQAVVPAFNSGAAASAAPTVCPKCGGKLIRRTAGRGVRAGKPFLGCANFRKGASDSCGYIFNLED